MKKFVFMILAAMVAAAAVTGCPPGGANPAASPSADSAGEAS